MREKRPRFIVTFFTTAEAMATEKVCKACGIGGKLISTPRVLSADCGISFSAEPADKERVIAALQENGIEVQGYHELCL